MPINFFPINQTVWTSATSLDDCRLKMRAYCLRNENPATCVFALYPDLSSMYTDSNGNFHADKAYKLGGIRQGC